MTDRRPWSLPWQPRLDNLSPSRHGALVYIAAGLAFVATDSLTKSLVAEIPVVHVIFGRHVSYLLVILLLAGRRHPRRLLATARPWTQLARGLATQRDEGIHRSLFQRRVSRSIAEPGSEFHTRGFELERTAGAGRGGTDGGAGIVQEGGHTGGIPGGTDLANGSGGHLAGEMFKAKAGIFAVHIPYNGGSPAQLALLSAQVDFNFDNLATAAANIKSGKLKALAVTTAQRSPALPDIPAVGETLSGFAVDTWWGLVAPAATPKDIIAKLNQAFVAALNSPEVKTRFGLLLAEPVPTTPEQFGIFMKDELAKYEKVVKASGAKVD